MSVQFQGKMAGHFERGNERLVFRDKWWALLKGVMSVRFQGKMLGPFERVNERSVSGTNGGPF